MRFFTPTWVRLQIMKLGLFIAHLAGFTPRTGPYPQQCPQCSGVINTTLNNGKADDDES